MGRRDAHGIGDSFEKRGRRLSIVPIARRTTYFHPGTPVSLTDRPLFLKLYYVYCTLYCQLKMQRWVDLALQMPLIRFLDVARGEIVSYPLAR